MNEFSIENRRTPDCDKSGTVVPLSDFQSTLNLSIRACGYGRAHARKLYVLIVCEESQAECMAFRQLGHEAYSLDLQKARYNPDWHICADATPFLSAPVTSFVTQSGVPVTVPYWDLMICHPPCTYLCRVSSSVLYKDFKLRLVKWSRIRGMILGRRFFMKCYESTSAQHVLVENPIPMMRVRLPRPSFYACPSWFGAKYSKKTLYWTRTLPPLFPEIFFPNPKCFVRCSRGKYRSRTNPLLAEAIARQYSEFILNEYASES